MSNNLGHFHRELENKKLKIEDGIKKSNLSRKMKDCALYETFMLNNKIEYEFKELEKLGFKGKKSRILSLSKEDVSNPLMISYVDGAKRHYEKMIKIFVSVKKGNYKPSYLYYG